ncbi:MAG: AMIN domain-containing protein [Gemmatimonadetes bacterium]|nr:AMIN domain-containing protein [Gemmatimonadota bacterium]
MTFSSWSLAAAAMLSFAAATPAHREPDGAEVRAMSLVSTAGKAEFTIQVAGAVSVNDFALSDPARVVVDLAGAVLPPRFKSSYDGVNRAGVIGMRVRQYDESTVRVVLVLERAKPYTVAQTDDGIRVSFGADESFVAWSTAGAAAPVAAAAKPTPAPVTPVVVEPTDADQADALEPAAAPAPERRLVAVAPVQQRQEPRITVSWDNASIQEVIAGFQAISGRSIILGKAIDVKVSAEIRDKPWPDAFKAVLGAYGLSAQEVEGGIIRVDAPETLAAIDSLEPLQTEVLKVNYANAGELAATVKGVVSKRGAVTADTATNSLIVRETRTVLPSIIDFARGLDVRPPQIAIQAKIIFVDRTDVEQLGFRYDLATGGQFYNKIIQRPDPTNDDKPFQPGVNIVDLGGNAISAIANADAFVQSSALDLTYSIALGGFTLTSFLTALERVDLTDVQTEPVITTKDNKKASLLVGEEIPLRVIDASSLGGGAGQLPRATVQFKEVGIKLNVTPHVTNNRQIVLDIETERSAVKILSAADLGFSIDKQSTKNEILVNDGETAVIGGLTVTTVTRAKTGIPLLSSLPILGNLFAFTTNTENRKDLIILVTPRIVDDAAQEN